MSFLSQNSKVNRHISVLMMLQKSRQGPKASFINFRLNQGDIWRKTTFYFFLHTYLYIFWEFPEFPGECKNVFAY